MRMRSDEEAADASGTPVKGPFAVYLDMLETHAVDDVENEEGIAIPVAHPFWLASVALIVLVLARSEILALIIVCVMLLWLVGVSGYYWRARRRHRIAMGLPAPGLRRYWLQEGAKAAVVLAVWIGVQLLLRHFF